MSDTGKQDVQEQYWYFYSGTVRVANSTGVTEITFSGTFQSAPKDAFRAAKCSIAENDFERILGEPLPKDAKVLITKLNRL